MVTIRLARHGAKKNPFYHVTVTDRAAPRDGRFVERVGFFNPVARGHSEKLRIDLARVDHWLAVGAQPSERVSKLIKQARADAAALAAGVAAETDAATAEQTADAAAAAGGTDDAADTTIQAPEDSPEAAEPATESTQDSNASAAEAAAGADGGEAEQN